MSAETGQDGDVTEPETPRPSARPRVVVAGLGDTGVLMATRLARWCDVVGISTRAGLVCVQELGNRLTDLSQWRQSYLVPYRRFLKLDRVKTIHGRITSVDLDRSIVHVERASGGFALEHYDALVIATGASNGFWRHDRVQDLDAIDAELAAVAAELQSAATVAVVGGGATGVSVASNLARKGDAQVHLFHSGAEPLPGYHPKVRSWMAQELRAGGVTVHPDHRAVVPDGFTGERLTTEPIEWSTGQEPFQADLTLWAVGQMRPHTSFLPAELLDGDGFVLVDQHLRVPGHANVFAVGDVAASDPFRSSARNWGWKVVTANVRNVLRGKGGKLQRYKAPAYRWGSILGLQDDGMVVVQPDGKRFRIPRWAAEPLLFRLFVTRYLYGGLRPFSASGGRPRVRP